MPKIRISFFFILVFTVYLTAPTIISVIEKSFDTSVFYSMNEEENKGGESLKLFELDFIDQDALIYSLLDFQAKTSHNYYSVKYTPWPLECISPPPELG